MAGEKHECTGKYEAIDVARYVINYCNDHGYEITNLKLQKILYFIQANFLTENNFLPCFNDEIQAWDFGPVVPSVYHAFKSYGNKKIPKIDKYSVYSDGSWNVEEKNFNVDDFDPEDRDLMDDMIEQCSKYTTSQLVAITHNQSPWKSVYTKGANQAISNESIRNYFKED